MKNVGKSVFLQVNFSIKFSIKDKITGVYLLSICVLGCLIWPLLLDNNLSIWSFSSRLTLLHIILPIFPLPLFCPCLCFLHSFLFSLLCIFLTFVQKSLFSRIAALLLLSLTQRPMCSCRTYIPCSVGYVHTQWQKTMCHLTIYWLRWAVFVPFKRVHGIILDEWSSKTVIREQ